MSAAFDKPIPDSARKEGGRREFDTGLPAAEIDPQRPLPVATPWGTVALYVIEGELCAYEAFCPHMLGPLFAGSIADGRAVTCPWHAWRYDLRDGARIDDECPADGEEARALERYDVRVSEQGTVVVSSAVTGTP